MDPRRAVTHRILVAEDEPAVATGVERALHQAEYVVQVAVDANSALDHLLAPPSYDLAVLDVTLPPDDGFAVLRTLRARGVQTSVLLMTAGDTVADRVLGLDLGADDCLAKPFAQEELLARVRALSRRRVPGRPAALRLADLTLDPTTREVMRAGRRIRPTARECALLEYFLRNAGGVLTRPMILEHVWDLHFDPGTNIIDVYVRYLRRKIDRDGGRPLLHTVRGRGYGLMTNGEDATPAQPQSASNSRSEAS